MKILVINTQIESSYGTYLLSLLQALLPPEDVIIKENFSSRFPFFQKLKLQRVIKKERVRCIMHFTEGKLISSTLPQLIAPLITGALLIKKPLPSTSKIIVSSEYEKEAIASRYPFLETNLHIIHASVSPRFQPISWSEKQALKLQYTQGREYFMASGKNLNEAAFTALLKAFSSFKKWQHSGMKLVITGTLSFIQRDEWKEKMKSYKYREDVVMTEDLVSSDVYSSWLAGTYAFLHLPLQNNDVIAALEAMQCETPCISFASEVRTEYSGEAVLFIEKDNYESVSEAMISLYKDEAKRSRLIEEGKSRCKSLREMKLNRH